MKEKHVEVGQPKATVEKKETVFGRARRNLFEAMAKSHEAVNLAMDMEEALVAGADLAGLEQFRARLDKLDPLTVRRLETIWDEYCHKKRQARFKFEELKKMCNQELEVRRKRPLSEPFALGDFLFEARTGQSTASLKYLELRESYLVLTVFDLDDYIQLIAGTHDVKELELYRSSHGVMFHAVKFEITWPPATESKKIFTVILVRGAPAVAESKMLQATGILAHERQHFINDALFDFFEETEVAELIKLSKIPNNVAAVRRFRQIKDEVLAFIRDGCEPETVPKELNSKLYEHLFSSMPGADPSPGTGQNEHDLAQQILVDIKNELMHPTFQFFKNQPRIRAFLVYYLAAAPLDVMPRALRTLRHYLDHYRKLLQTEIKADDSEILSDALRSNLVYPDDEKQLELRVELRELARRALAKKLDFMKRASVDIFSAGGPAAGGLKLIQETKQLAAAMRDDLEQAWVLNKQLEHPDHQLKSVYGRIWDRTVAADDIENSVVEEICREILKIAKVQSIPFYGETAVGLGENTKFAIKVTPNSLQAWLAKINQILKSYGGEEAVNVDRHLVQSGPRISFLSYFSAWKRLVTFELTFNPNQVKPKI